MPAASRLPRRFYFFDALLARVGAIAITDFINAQQMPLELPCHYYAASLQDAMIHTCPAASAMSYFGL